MRIRPRGEDSRAVGLRIALALVLAMTAIACTNAKFRSNAQFDTSYDFDSIETFAFDPVRENVANSPTGKLVEQALRDELTKRGFEEAPKSQADVLINYDVGVYASARLSGSNQLQHQQGGITVWVMDAKTGQNIWYGWSERGLSSKDEAEPTVRLAVQALFENRVPRNQ